MSEKYSRGIRKAVNFYTWLVCSKIAKYNRGARELTQGIMVSARHEPTQDGAFGEGHELTKDCAGGAGHESPEAVLSMRGTSPPKLTPGIGKEGARSWPVHSRWIPLYPTGWGLVNPTGLKLVKPLK